jgi:hypothetical protein
VGTPIRGPVVFEVRRPYLQCLWVLLNRSEKCCAQHRSKRRVRLPRRILNSCAHMVGVNDAIPATSTSVAFANAWLWRVD